MRLFSVLVCTVIACAGLSLQAATLGAGSIPAEKSAASRSLSKELQLVGGSAYSVDSAAGTIRIRQSEVRNNRFTGVSGQLSLQMWECSAPFEEDGSTLTFMIGRVNIGTLAAGASSAPVDTVTTFFVPPDGTYFTVLLLVEDSMAGSFFYDFLKYDGNNVYENGVGRTVSPPKIVGITSATGKQGAPFTLSYTANGQFPITFSATGLPAGLTLVNSQITIDTFGINDPIIKGIPSKAGVANVTINAENPSGEANSALTLDIKDKNTNAAPTILFAGAEPTTAFTGERVQFFAGAYDPENASLKYTWNYKDGFTGVGQTAFHTFTTAGTYVVDLTVSDGTLSATTTVPVTVIGFTSNNPFIDSIASNLNPSLVNQEVTFTATAVSPVSEALTYQWNFGDGTAVATGNPVTHSYTTKGEYNVSVAVQDVSGRFAVFTEFVQFVADSSDPSNNILTGKPSESPDGIQITVLPAPTGVLALDLALTSRARVVNRAGVEFATEILFPGRQAATVAAGQRPTQRVGREGVGVATATGVDPATPDSKMVGRKTIPVGAVDLGLTPDAPDTLTADQRNLIPSKLSGKFGFTTDAPDTVSFSVGITIPAGYDLTRSHELSVGIANVADRIVLDAKGKATGLSDRGLFKKVKMKYPKSSATAGVAKLDVTIVAPNLDKAGFESDGVTPNAVANLNLQLAVVLAGLPYSGEMPATLKITSKKDKATMKMSK